MSSPEESRNEEKSRSRHHLATEITCRKNKAPDTEARSICSGVAGTHIVNRPLRPVDEYLGATQYLVMPLGMSKGAETTLLDHLARVSKLDVGEIRLVSLFSISDRSFSNSEPYSNENKADRGSILIVDR